MMLWLAMVVMFGLQGTAKGADLVIRIPGDPSKQDGFYRLQYRNQS